MRSEAGLAMARSGRALIVRAALAAGATLVAFCAAQAREQAVQRRVEPGASVEILSHSSVRRDCASKAPVVRILTPPEHGEAVVREGRRKLTASGAFAHCDGMFGTGAFIDYKAKEGFSGQDRLRYEARFASGTTLTVTALIGVGVAPAPLPAPLPVPSLPPGRSAPGAAPLAKLTTGSGFYVTAAGHIVTNEHVARACQRIEIKGVGPAKLIGADAKVDLALLKVETAAPVSPVRMRAAPAKLGQEVVVFGFPLQSILGNGLNVTTGIVSSEAGLRNDASMLQFTAAIQPGNSGGPIVDRTGALIGVVKAKFSDRLALERGAFVPQSLNFGIRASVLATFLKRHEIVMETAEEGPERSIADLASAARERTLLISCHRTP